MQKKKEVLEECQEQPQKKMGDMWKQKYFMLHTWFIILLAAPLIFTYKRKTG